MVFTRNFFSQLCFKANRSGIPILIISVHAAVCNGVVCVCVCVGRLMYVCVRVCSRMCALYFRKGKLYKQITTNLRKKSTKYTEIRTNLESYVEKRAHVDKKIVRS